MKKPAPKNHYSGTLRIKRGKGVQVIYGGGAACMRIRGAVFRTRVRLWVTCKRCLALMSKAEPSEQPPTSPARKGSERL